MRFLGDGCAGRDPYSLLDMPRTIAPAGVAGKSYQIMLVEMEARMLLRAGCAALALFTLSAAAPNAAPFVGGPVTETPIWSNDLVDSIGENTHCTFASIGWVDCRNAPGAAAAIKTLGVRHLRDGISDYWRGFRDNGQPHIPTYKVDGVATPVSTFYNALASQAGVKFDFVISLKYGNHAPYVNDVVTAVPSTEAFELGGNEPDSPYTPDPCPSPNPDGRSCWPSDSVSQIEYYSSYVKAAGRLRIGPSVEFGKDYTCSSVPGSQRVVLSPEQCPQNGAPNLSVVPQQTEYLDANNLHHYAAENHPGNNILAKYRVTARDVAAPGTTWITEAGYGTGKNGNTDERISKYEPRIFTEHFYQGVARTYQFEMFDQPRPAAGPYFDSFGLVAVDLSTYKMTPKPQYESLRSLIQIMNDPGTRPTLAPVSYRITGGDAKLHHILAQRQDGSYQLLMWIEGPDPSPAQTVDVAFCQPAFTVGAVSRFTPANGQYANATLAPTQRGGCSVFGPLHVTDSMQIYRFAKTPFTLATPLARAQSFAAADR